MPTDPLTVPSNFILLANLVKCDDKVGIGDELEGQPMGLGEGEVQGSNLAQLCHLRGSNHLRYTQRLDG